MNVNLLFLIGAPRSGTTMLEHILSAHSMIQGGPEPHLMTPLAHLGVWDKVYNAPYDHILAAEAQRLFVEQLPNREQDYWDACRAYCDTLYGRFLQAKGTKPICLDKTPAYGLILPFISKVYPDAKYVVLTRHPLAMFSSFANSFFAGDYHEAQRHNSIIDRYVPALAAFLRQPAVPNLHVRYEDFVKDPEAGFERICAYLGVPFEKEAIEYGAQGTGEKRPEGLGDPIGVAKDSRPNTKSVSKWAQELASDPRKLAMMKAAIARMDPADLETLGYPIETLWQPLEALEGAPAAPAKSPMTRYRLQRMLIVRLRARARRHGWLHKVLRKAQLTCDVLLREQ